MQSLTATEARKSFFEIIKNTNSCHEVYEIQHKSGKAVILSSDEYESMVETLELLSEPSFKEKFEDSIKEADQGEVVTFDEVFGEAL